MSGCFDSEKKSITSLSCLEDRFDVYVKLATHYANKLDESIKRLEQYCSDQDRIRKTEIEDCESDIVCIKGKLEKLEANVEEDIEEIKRVLKEHYKSIYHEIRKPYQCPNCSGNGSIKSHQFASNYQPIHYFHCYACDGKGIVWK